MIISPFLNALAIFFLNFACYFKSRFVIPSTRSTEMCATGSRTQISACINDYNYLYTFDCFVAVNYISTHQYLCTHQRVTIRRTYTAVYLSSITYVHVGPGLPRYIAVTCMHACTQQKQFGGFHSKRLTIYITQNQDLE